MARLSKTDTDELRVILTALESAESTVKRFRKGNSLYYLDASLNVIEDAQEKLAQLIIAKGFQPNGNKPSPDPSDSGA